MKIDRIELFHVAMPLIYPWRTAYGEDQEIHSVLCRVSSGSVDGWGESSPLAAPCYSPEWAGGVFATVHDWLAPALLGKDIETGQQLQQRLQFYKGNPFAKAVLDNAWWSLHSNVANLPLHVALGARRDKVTVGADFGIMDSIDELLTAIAQAIDDRFPRIKLKFRPGWGVEMLTAVRRLTPDYPIHIDCNSGYRLTDLDLFKTVDNFRLQMIEQPLQHDDVVDHAQLQRQLTTPICLDESIVSLTHARQAIELGSCRFVNIKPGRVGGLTNAVAIHDRCQQSNIPCWVGGMLESAVGSSQCTALAMLDNFTYPADIFPSERFYRQDLADPPLQLTDMDGVPAVEAYSTPPEPVPARLAQLSVQHAIIR
jgi:O-succinylbenzoate synthase